MGEGAYDSKALAQDSPGDRGFRTTDNRQKVLRKSSGKKRPGEMSWLRDASLTHDTLDKNRNLRR